MTRPKRRARTRKAKAGARRPGARSRERWLLFAAAALLVVALVLRLRFVTNPLLDFHAQRQVDTAAVARNFLEEGMNIFYPRVDWRGTTPGYVEMEFPLYSYLVALLYAVFGVHEIVGRLLSIAFAMGAAWYIFRTARRLVGDVGALFALGLYAFAPLAVYFTRTFQPEAFYLFCASASIWYYLLYLEEGRRRDAVLATAFLSIAFLVKIAIAVALFFLYLALGVRHRGARFLADPLIWVVALVPSALAGLWTWHAGRLYAMTGLSFTRWLMTREAFVSAYWLTAPAYWNVVWNQRFLEDLTPVGFAVAAVGAAVCAFQRRWRPILWANAGFLVYFFLFARANFAHHYYQLIGVIAACLAAAVAGQALYEAAAAREWPAGPVAAGALVALLVVGGVWYASITANWYLIASHFFDAAKALEAVSAPRDLVVTVTDNGMGEMLYYAHRKGANLSGVPTLEELDRYRRDGYRFLVVSATLREVEENQRRLLRLAAAYRMVQVSDYFVVFQLR